MRAEELYANAVRQVRRQTLPRVTTAGKDGTLDRRAVYSNRQRGIRVARTESSRPETVRARMEAGPPPSKRHRLSRETQSLRGTVVGVAYHYWAEYARFAIRERMEAVRYERIKDYDHWQANMEGLYWCSTCFDMGCGHGECPYCVDDCHGI
eukprot:COSAG01_NODE_3229_length_6382_cov_76.522521_4_plen_152_part_00